MKIVLSGGHLTPAYSFTEICEKNDKVLLIGSRDNDSIEATELAKLGATYQKINPVKYDRNHKLLSIVSIHKILIPIIQSLYKLHKWKPDVVLLFGSYNAVPIGIAAFILRIPFIIHEQTSKFGLANQLLKYLANSCVISYSSSASYYPKTKTIHIGNLVRHIFWDSTTTFSTEFPSKKPILYVTGGNQGSQKLIDTILPQASRLSSSYQLVIQYGNVSLKKDELRGTNILARKWFDANDTAYLMQHGRIIITRTGANTTSEIMISGIPSICIPLINTTQNEQLHNAHLLTDNGAGILIEQPHFDDKTLLSALSKIEHKYDEYKNNAKKLKRMQNQNASRQLYEIVKNITVKSK